jgi:2-desacetyl-2-hydroxyethyl bacteriochlorophyllide A dehydrogenase
MRALAVVQPGRLELQERSALVADAARALVAPHVVGVCGTDLDIIDGTIDPNFVRYPLVIGHEFAGTLRTPAGEVEAGARVVVEGIVPCGTCAECLRGATNRCETYDELGFIRDGAAADLLLAPNALIHPLAAAVSWESGALVEPAAVVWRALGRATPQPGSRALIVGDGTVALLAALLVRQFEPAEVVMLGAREDQAALAASVGADRFVTAPDQAGHGYDLVVEAAGSAAATAAALAAPSRGGTVVLLGYPGADQVGLPVDDIVNGDVTIIGSFAYTRDAWREVVALLNSGALDLSSLVTHRFPLSDFAEAVATLRNSSGPRGKILLEID